MLRRRLFSVTLIVLCTTTFVMAQATATVGDDRDRLKIGPDRQVLGAGVAQVVIDCSKTIGALRPLLGVSSGPVQAGGTLDLSNRFRELAVPFTRLHDCHWPNPDVVDIHTIFPDPNADPSQATNYQFERTDDYLRSVLDVRSAIIYRLGESIEHSKRKYHVNPPADPRRWAAVCAGIVRHYDQGWAGGLRHAVRYWEIWNEPENRPQMWTGNDREFLDLYVATAKAVKEQAPDALVGGPGFGYLGRLDADRLQASPFVLNFLARCREEDAALDFFSWHCYSNDPRQLVRLAKAVRRLLDEHGFANTESHLNEWSFLPDNDWKPMLGNDPLARQHWFERQGGCEGAAFAAAALMLLQNAPVDVAAYYSADTHGFGLFNEYGVPKKVFYALKAFRQLCDAPRRIAIENGSESLVVAAGMSRDRSRLIVLTSNLNSAPQNLALTIKALPWRSATQCRVKAVDDQHDLTPTGVEELSGAEVHARPITLPPFSVTVLEFAPVPAANLESAHPQ